MFTFYKKLFVLIIPLLFSLGIPVLIYYAGLEHLSDKESYKLQNSNKEIKYGKAYSNNADSRNFNYILAQKPDFLILGASRVANFKCEDFSNSCYNANINARSIEFYLKYLTEFKNNGYTPKKLLLGLEQWFFNDNFHIEIDFSGIEKYKENVDSSVHISFYAYRKIVDDFFSGKINIIKLLSSKNIGVSSRMFGTGWNIYGSPYDYDFIKLNKTHYGEDGHKSTVYRIKNGIYSGLDVYVCGNIVSKNSLQELERLLIFCHENKIDLFIFLAPFSPDVLQVMRDSGKYKYLDDLNKEICKYTDEYGYLLFDYTEIEGFGITHYSDTHHADPFVYQKITSEIVERIR